MSIREIKERYPVGCMITDCFGGKGLLMRHHNIGVSKFYTPGTLIMGGQHIYCAKTGNWAEVELTKQ
jgi:hypothetical protein